MVLIYFLLSNWPIFIVILKGVTVPLITNDSGEKLGKSVGNALWLDENLSTPYECYQVSKFFFPK